MARRKRHSEEELPFVALMDTMTNVVGVLIIVLVMIGISLANAVKKCLQAGLQFSSQPANLGLQLQVFQCGHLL